MQAHETPFRGDGGIHHQMLDLSERLAALVGPAAHPRADFVRVPLPAVPENTNQRFARLRGAQALRPFSGSKALHVRRAQKRREIRRRQRRVPRGEHR